MKNYLLSILLTAIAISSSIAVGKGDAKPQVASFGEKGQVKMIYDARQRPQSVYMNDKLHIVFNGGARAKDSKNDYL